MKMAILVAAVSLSFLGLQGSAWSEGDGSAGADGDGQTGSEPSMSDPDADEAAAVAAGQVAAEAVANLAEAQANLSAIMAGMNLGFESPDTLAAAQEAVNQAAVVGFQALADFAQATLVATDVSQAQLQAVLDAVLANHPPDYNDVIPGLFDDIADVAGGNLPRFPRQPPPPPPPAPPKCTIASADAGVVSVAAGASRKFYATEWNAKICATQTRTCSVVKGAPVLSGSYLFTSCNTGRPR